HRIPFGVLLSCGRETAEIEPARLLAGLPATSWDSSNADVDGPCGGHRMTRTDEHRPPSSRRTARACVLGRTGTDRRGSTVAPASRLAGPVSGRPHSVSSRIHTPPAMHAVPMGAAPGFDA